MNSPRSRPEAIRVTGIRGHSGQTYYRYPAGASSDWEALGKLRGPAFAELAPEPVKQMLLPITPTGEDHEWEKD